MVCLPCVVIPIFLWVWFNFIMPLLIKLKSLIFPQCKSLNEKENSESEKSKKECPFNFSKSQKIVNSSNSDVSSSQVKKQE
jgi:hypothetical protein